MGFASVLGCGGLRVGWFCFLGGFCGVWVGCDMIWVGWVLGS